MVLASLIIANTASAAANDDNDDIEPVGIGMPPNAFVIPSRL